MATRFRRGRRLPNPRFDVEEAISPHALEGSNSSPTPGGSSAPAPSAPAPSYQAPDFRDAQYTDTMNLAGRNRDDLIAYLTGQQANLRSTYGYTDDNFTIDPNNPYGRAQLAKRVFDQSRRGTEGGYAARGQMTSGAYGRAQSNNLFNYQAAENQNRLGYATGSSEIAQRIREAQGAYGATEIQAGGEALARAIAARNAGPAPQVTQPRGLGPNERVATSAQDGGRWVYRLTNGKWLRVRRA